MSESRKAHECILAVVGSTYDRANRATVEAVQQAIREAFDRHDPRGFVSGGARGVDSWAAAEAYRRGMTASDVHEYLPLHKRWAPQGFKDRNIIVATEAECLVRIYDPGSRTYGSGFTADRARELGRPVELVVVARQI